MNKRRPIVSPNRQAVPPPLSQRAILPQSYKRNPTSTPLSHQGSSDSISSTYVNFHVANPNALPSSRLSDSATAVSHASRSDSYITPTRSHFRHSPQPHSAMVSSISCWSPDSSEDEYVRGNRGSGSSIMRRLSDAASGLARRLSSGSSKPSSKQSSSSEPGRRTSRSFPPYYRYGYYQDDSRRVSSRCSAPTFRGSITNADHEKGKERDSVDEDLLPIRISRSSGSFRGSCSQLLARINTDRRGRQRRRRQDNTPPLSRSSQYAAYMSRRSSTGKC
ncbi:uncharacterized protein PG998_007148 [Apiospora kogelbergensis]|uniref:uncharacterized protein n=1 Tax=Apiospora kogelbergensis TaxID=1337665 RepID=UPI00312E98FA